jgi:hypothetical protein
VYRWNTGALAVMWDVNGPQLVSKCRPDLSDAEKREIDFGGLAETPTLASWQDQS